MDVTGGRDRSYPAPKSEIGSKGIFSNTLVGARVQHYIPFVQRSDGRAVSRSEQTPAWHSCMQVLPVPVQPNQVLGPPVVVYTPVLVPIMSPPSPSLTPSLADWSGSGHSKMVWGGVPAREASYHSLGEFAGAGTEASNPAPVSDLPLMVGGGAVAGGHFFRDTSALRKSNSNDSIHSDGCAPVLLPQPPCRLRRPRFAPPSCHPKKS